MITNLALQAQVVLGGESIAVFKWTLANQSLAVLGECVSRLQMAILEMDSNNTTGGMIPHDAESIAGEWNRAKYEWSLAKEFRYLAPAAQEKILTVLAITDNEVLRVPNVKCRRAVQALATFLQKINFCDSSKLQYGLTDSDIKKLDQHITYVDRILTDYVGNGLAKDAGFDTGMSVPAFEHLGVVVPPINLHEAQIQEPSPAAPDVPSPDAPDTPSTIPAPGSNTQPK
tara:strand:- start:4434 stop:5120 length:687 start_codon:yes stop_codon:yes gene_type:complete